MSTAKAMLLGAAVFAASCEALLAALKRHNDNGPSDFQLRHAHGDNP